MNIAILTSPNQWFVPYAKELTAHINNSSLFFNHEEIGKEYQWVFILSYHRIIPKIELDKHQHNLVIHASALPLGKGWAPLFWQVLEGENSIPFSLFEASEKMDDGDIYLQRKLNLTGYELNDELRKKQAIMIQRMCLDFINNNELYKNPIPQTGSETLYPKRSLKDSELNPDKTIREQFNLLRIVNNQDYPAFFYLDGHRYIVKIENDYNRIKDS